MMKQGRSFSGLERNCAFLNTGSGGEAESRFATVSSVSGVDFPDDGRALVAVDWDQDGDLDLWISSRNAPRLRFLQNNSRSGNHFLSIKLTGDGIQSNRDAIGARVELLTSPQKKQHKMIQTLRAGEGFLSQKSKWLHFGLLPNLKIDKILVHWPGGKNEEFTGIKVNRRYSLVQGTGTAQPLPTREELRLQASLPIIPEPSQQARIPLLTRLPKTTINYVDFDGKRALLNTGLGKSTLVTLWAGWCPTCKRELTEFTEQAQAFEEAGIDILALSVDGLGDERSDLDKAQNLLKKLNFPFATGRATQQLIKEFQELHDLLIPLKHPLPVPTSFLIDSSGRVSVIYKGLAHSEDIMNDAKERGMRPAEKLSYAAPMPGQAVNDPVIDRVFVENQARGLFYYGTLLMDRKRTDEAILYFQDVLALRPKSYKTHYNLGLAYRKRKNIAAALYHFKQALANNPEFVEAHLMLGKILLHQDQLEKAEKHYLRYLAAYPDSATTLADLGVVAVNLGEFDKAEHYFSKALRVDPHLIEARYNLGAMLLAQGKSAEAEAIFLSLLKSQPGYPDLHYNMGLIHEQRKDLEQAAHRYSQELSITPRSAKTLVAMGRVLEKKGSYLQAGRYYSRAISLRPDFIPALQGQARLRSR